MTPLEFLRSPAAVAALERAARASAVPMSLHFIEGEEEGPKVLGFGQCAACRMAEARLRGRAACRASRLPATVAALRRGRCETFICHLGFVCVSIPAIPGTGFALTFGPFCPSEAPQTLRQDAWQGLINLGVRADDAKAVDLSDIRIVPADAMPELAEWAVATLAGLWDAHTAAENAAPSGPDEEPEAAQRRGKSGAPLPDPYQSADIAAALAGGDQAHARVLLEGALTESDRRKRPRIAVRRARAVATVSAALDAAERAQVDTTGCWERYPAFVEQAMAARSDGELVAAATSVLAVIRRKAQRRSRQASEVAVSASGKVSLPKLRRLTASRIAEKIALNEVAGELGVHPTAVTHWLQRKFGVSFSQFIGRLRVDKAKELLRRTKLPPREVAQRVGIADMSNFGRLFRKFEGMSPLEYRKRYGERS